MNTDMFSQTVKDRLSSVTSLGADSLGRLNRIRKIVGTVRKATRDFGELRALGAGEPTLSAMHEISGPAAKELLGLMNVRIVRTGESIDSSPGLLVGNHISYIDVLLLYLETHVSFLAKIEVGKWPIFGEAMRGAGTVFVKREEKSSRQQARLAIADAILNAGRKIAVFPEGTTSLTGRPWRTGLFTLAHASEIPVQPFRIRYSPARICAYIDDDGFVPHLWKVLGQSEIVASIEYAKPFFVTHPERDAARLQAWTIQPS